MRLSVCLFVAAVGGGACDTAGPSQTTGLTGTVVRGPVTPVCRIEVPCDAPFSARFSVERAGRRVAAFQSDTAGAFTVWIDPGAYAVVPGADAPLLSPGSQAKRVMVGENGLTTVRLMFDTGIR